MALVIVWLSDVLAIVVVAAGNEGNDGVYSVAAPSTALSALSVASVINQVYNPPYRLNITGLEDEPIGRVSHNVALHYFFH